MDIINGKVGRETADTKNSEAHKKDGTSKNEKSPVAQHRPDLGPNRFGGPARLLRRLFFTAQQDRKQSQTRHQAGESGRNPTRPGDRIWETWKLD